MNHKKSFENEIVKMEVRDNILYKTFKSGSSIDINDIRSIVHIRNEMLKDREMPCIVTDLGIVSISRSARVHFTSPEGFNGLVAAAFIQNTFFSKMLFRFIFDIEAPGIPIRTFREMNDAVEWAEFKNLQIGVNKKSKIVSAA